MASKTIHICDRCKSYVDENQVVDLAIRLTVPSTTKGNSIVAVRVRTLPIAPRQRELCLPCAEEVTEEYLLEEAKTTDKLFKDFSLPSLSSDDSNDSKTESERSDSRYDILS
jgi:hypothetical protein